MAYNLYQAQMARAWAQRIEKENAVAEQFWTTQALKATQQIKAHHQGDAASHAGSHVSSACPSGYTSKTTYLKERLDRLEGELREERERRKRVEQDLQAVRAGVLTAGSRPITPADSH